MRSIRWQAILGASLGCLLGAGCGATELTVPGGDTGGTSGTGGSTSGGARYQGSVGFAFIAFGGKTSFASTASFNLTPPSPAAGTCPGGTQQGSCCYFSAATIAVLEKATPPADVSAGALTLQDRGSTLANLSFTGQGYTSVSSDTVHSLVWNPGDLLDVVAAGASSGIGPFAGTVVAPAPLQALHPDLATLAILSRSSDFRLTWTGIVSGTVALSIGAVASASSSSTDGVIVCTGSSADGSLDVPAALLGNLPSGDHALVELIMANTATVAAPNANIEIGAGTVVLSGPTLE